MIQGEVLGTAAILLLAVVLTAVLVETTRRFAPALGLVDTPTARKSHKGDIPLVGGISIFLGLILTLPFFGIVQEHWPFLVAAALLVSIGVFDDAFGISPSVRLVFQGAAVLFLILLGDTVLVDLGALLPGVEEVGLGWLAIPFTVFVGTGLINAFNMSDGVDGLCGTLALIALTGLGVVAALANRHAELVLIVILAGALVGFLVFNMRLPGRSQAKVFLGDAGSYLLGLSVLYLAIQLSQGSDRAMAPVSALWFCMVPLFDATGMILRRIRRGESPFTADREHIHHVFLLAKFSVGETWAGLTIAALGGLAIGLVSSIVGASEMLMLVTFVAAFLFYYWTIRRVWRLMRFLSRSINRRAAARKDRRSGRDRRAQTQALDARWGRYERRSGLERRCPSGDRRRAEEIKAEIAAQKEKNRTEAELGAQREANDPGEREEPPKVA